jgi:segregation and condensation protein A
MKEIITALEKESVLDFLEFFNRQESLEEAIVSFFSLLELIKGHLVMAVQERLFQTIKVWLRRGSKVRQ